MGCIQSLFNKAQASGVSPSSTTDSAAKAQAVQDAPLNSRPPSIGNVSTGKTEEPQSNDTSFGVEASAVRQLAADTGTLAIYSSTTGNSPAKEHEELPVVQEPAAVNEPTKEENPPAVPAVVAEDVEVTEPTESKEASESDSTVVVRQVPQITETLVASLDPSPSDENDKEIPARYSPDGTDQSSADASGKTEVTKSTECSDDQPVNQPKLDESKSDNNESTSTKTFENDISSEQLKTNSLSDLSFSELDEKDLPKVVEVVERIELSGSEAHSEPKLVEITPDSTSESSQQITKEESTSDITTDHQTDIQAEQDEEPLLDSGADESIEVDAEDKRKEAAIKIQSSFRGYQVRKARSTKPDEDDPTLTESEIENVKTQVDDIIKEAEVKTESLRNTPDIDEEVSPAAEEDFPAPPDDLQLSQMERDDSRDQDKDISLNIDPVPYPSSDEVSASNQEPSPPENEENTSAELARMTADEDLPAPDLDLLESSCTDDLNTELAAPEKVLDEEPRDSTEGDVTISEDSEELKQLQKPQECDDGQPGLPTPKTEGVDEDSAATKIQANVRGFLSRKQTQKQKKSDGAATQSEDVVKNADSPVVGTPQPERQQSSDESPLPTNRTVPEPAGSPSHTPGGEADETTGNPPDVATTVEDDTLENGEPGRTSADTVETPRPKSGAAEAKEKPEEAENDKSAADVEKDSGEDRKPDLPTQDEAAKDVENGDRVAGETSEPVVADDQDSSSVKDVKSEGEPSEARIPSEETVSVKPEGLETSERIEFSSPSPSHDPPRPMGNEDTYDKVSSTSESLSQDTTSQNTVEENPLAAAKQSAEDDKLDDVFDGQVSDAEGKPGQSEEAAGQSVEAESVNESKPSDEAGGSTPSQKQADQVAADHKEGQGESPKKVPTPPVDSGEDKTIPEATSPTEATSDAKAPTPETAPAQPEMPSDEPKSPAPSPPQQADKPAKQPGDQASQAGDLANQANEVAGDQENQPDKVASDQANQANEVAGDQETQPDKVASDQANQADKVASNQANQDDKVAGDLANQPDKQGTQVGQAEPQPAPAAQKGSDPVENGRSEEAELLNASATKIQANVRGYLTRKHQTNQTKE